MWLKELLDEEEEIGYLGDRWGHTQLAIEAVGVVWWGAGWRVKVKVDLEGSTTICMDPWVGVGVMDWRNW